MKSIMNPVKLLFFLSSLILFVEAETANDVSSNLTSNGSLETSQNGIQNQVKIVGIAYRDFIDFLSKKSATIKSLNYTKKMVIKAYLYQILENSINEKCANDKLSQFNWSEKWANHSSRIFDLDVDEMSELSVIYEGILLSCSTKMQSIYDFAFDFFMSISHIVKAFMDEPLLSKYFVYLRCANKYAIDNNFINKQEFPQVNTTLNESENLTCKKFVDEVTTKIQDYFQDFSDFSCQEIILNENFALLMRLLFIIQSDLKESQIEVERKNFFRNIKENYETLMTCSVSHTISV